MTAVSAGGGSIRMRNCTIIDATSPHARPRQSITVAAGRIADVSESAGPARGQAEREVDFAGRYVVPAVWDVHCHPGTAGPRDLDADLDGRVSRVRENIRRCVAHGVTGVRALGEAMLSDVIVRDELAAGRQEALAMFVAGPALKPPGGHGALATPPDRAAPALPDQWGSKECVGPEGFRAECRQLIQRHRVDWIKIFVSGGIAGDREAHTDTHMTQVEIEAVCAEAHARGVRVAAHAGNPEAIEMAACGGVDTIEHGYAMTADNAALLAERGVWYVPTLSITHNIDRMRAMSWSPASIAKAQALAATHRVSLQHARAAGVQIASGSDMRPLGRAGVEEVVLLGRECCTPWEALRIATAESARLCGASKDHGTIEVGKWANFIVTETNPLEDITALLNPFTVVHRGRTEPAS